MTFLILTVEFYFVFNTNRKSLKTLRYITLLICTFGASIGLEVLQNLVNPNRVFDINDIFCNMAGSLMGLGGSWGCQVWSIRSKKLQKNNYKKLNRLAQQQPDNEMQLQDEDDYVTIEIKDVNNT